MKLPEPIRKWLPLALITATAGSLGYFATKIIESAATPFWQHVAPAIPQKLLLSLCCLLLLVAAILVAWIYYLHRVHREPTETEKIEAFHAQFVEPMDQRGFWIHKKKPGFFCP